MPGHKLPSTPKKLLAVGLAAALSASLAACGGAPKAADPDDLATVTIMGPVLDQQAPAGDGILHKKMEELTGKKLNITWVPNSAYGERTNVTLAADNIPEVMVVQDKAPAFVRSAQAGAFWDLTEKLKSGKWSNLKAENEAMELNASINGKNYGVPRLRDPMRTAVIVRKDWLDKLGLQMPETTQDLYEIAKAFTTQDPGKGGIIIDVSSRANQIMNLFKQSDPENFTKYVDMVGNLRAPTERSTPTRRWATPGSSPCPGSPCPPKRNWTTC